MRLLNTTTLALTTFYDSSIPPYVILSHRWEAEEVTFEDICLPTVFTLAGYSKLIGCCKEALSQGWEWVWIDTCCIDKSSSAELSEAINSMFKWYKEARVCYAYLSDVPPGLGWEDHHRRLSQFRTSQWWKRGWTLQELLAPDHLVFYDREWGDIGTKSCMSILVSEISGIKHLNELDKACIAQKMSWAAKRKTTRVEDEAYCLMGLFGVHMAPLYGEGRNAFIRLQLEILKNSEDESIFAWAMPTFYVETRSGLLADSPRMFSESADVERMNLGSCFNTTLAEGLVPEEFDYTRPPSVMTSRGLRMEVFLYSRLGSLWLPLNCANKGKAIALELYCSENSGDSQFLCKRGGELQSLRYRSQPLDPASNRRIIFVQAQGSPRSIVSKRHMTYRCHDTREHGLRLRDTVLVGDMSGKLNEMHIKYLQARIYFSRYQVFVFTTYASSPDEQEQFIMLLDTNCNYGSTACHGIMLFVLGDNDIWKAISTCSFRNMFKPDRVSILLHSRKSVSAILKRIAGINETSYLIELSIDPTGKLRWPVQGNLKIPPDVEAAGESQV